jgi:hypothetical protein
MTKIYTMKLIRRLSPILAIVITALSIIGCDEDDLKVYTDLGSIASTYYEADGTGAITIPFRNVNSDLGKDLDISFGGSAVKDVDYELVAITNEGIKISIIDDDSLEVNETVRVMTNLKGNSTHTITIISNCEDTKGLLTSSFSGSWSALEDYGASGTFGPYNVTLVQDGVNPNKFTFSNFYGSGSSYTAYVILDLANGTASFPNQTVGAPSNDRGAITNSSGIFSLCTAKRTMTINLNYDGGDWVYKFTKN